MKTVSLAVSKKRGLSLGAICLGGALALGCVLIAVFEAALTPAYAVKSLVKVALFAGLPLLANRLSGGGHFQEMFRLNRKGLALTLALGLVVYGLIVGGYFLLRNRIDFSNIVPAQGGSGIDRGNLAWVALYVCLGNCFLEEFFFRGAGYLALSKVMNKKTAMVLSSACFSAYHIAIMAGWFAPLPFFGLLAALFVAGLFFCFLDDRAGSLLPSWGVHLFANLAIYTVAFMLF